MLVEFSIVPLGGPSSISRQVAAALDIVEKSGLPYKVNPMGTVVEGQWEEVIGTVRKCHEEVLAGNERVVTTIRIDDRKGRTGMIEGKIRSVEEKLGRELRK